MANVNGSAGEDWALVHSSSFNGIVRLTAGFPKGIGYVGTVAPTPTTPGFSIDRDGEQLTIPFGEAFYLRAYKGNVSVTLVPVGGAGTGGGYQVYEKTTNNQPAVFTSTANRDAYFTAQASELDSINNSGFAIGIGTVAEDPQQSNISQWQARIEGSYDGIEDAEAAALLIKVGDVKVSLDSGYLGLALYESNLLTVDAVFTQPRKDELLALISAYFVKFPTE